MHILYININVHYYGDKTQPLYEHLHVYLVRKERFLSRTLELMSWVMFDTYSTYTVLSCKQTHTKKAPWYEHNMIPAP